MLNMFELRANRMSVWYNINKEGERSPSKEKEKKMTTFDPLDKSYTSMDPPTVGSFVSEQGGGYGIVVSTPFGPNGHFVYVRVTWLGIGGDGISDSVTLDARITNLEASSAEEVYWISGLGRTLPPATR